MNEQEIRKSFVDVAVRYLGTQENSAAHEYIVDTYNQIKPLPVDYKLKYTDSWCAAFVSFCAKKCDLLDIVPAECSCIRQIALWQKLGRWRESDDYIPKTGDIIYYDWDDNGVGDNKGVADHVGIVVSVSGNMIKVIEGNKSDAVGYREIAVDGKFIRGYGLPKFSSKVNSTISNTKESVFMMELPILRQGSKGEFVKALQILLMGRKFSLPKYGADGSYGPETVNAVKAFQKAKGLAQDGIAGKNTFSKLLLG